MLYDTWGAQKAVCPSNWSNVSAFVIIESRKPLESSWVHHNTEPADFSFVVKSREQLNFYLNY